MWDLFGRYSRKPTPQPDPKTVASWWDELGSLDASMADKTMRTMASRPAEAIQLLQEKLASPVVNAAAIDALILQLGDRDFATREAATKSLLQIPAAEKKLAAVADASDSVEVRNRAELVLDKLRRSAGLPWDRAIEVLIWIGTAEAKKLLADLAKGPDERLGRDAADALQRLN